MTTGAPSLDDQTIAGLEATDAAANQLDLLTAEAAAAGAGG